MAAESRLHRVFCKNTRQRRQQLGWTQQKVADLLGVTQGTYAAIESGRKEPGINLIERVSVVLQMPAALLLTETEPALVE